MRHPPSTESLLAAFLLWALAAASAEPPDNAVSASPPNPTLAQAVQPAYEWTERLADGAFDFVRSNLFDRVLPSSSGSALANDPDRDSSAYFAKILQERELSYLGRLEQLYSAQGDAGFANGTGTNADWLSGAAARQQLSAVAGALGDTLVDRYRLNRLGPFASADAQGFSHWEGDFTPLAGLAGGAALYLNGLRASTGLGAMRFGVHLAPAMRIQGGTVGSAAGVELRYKDSPLVLASSWDLEHGNFCNERWLLNYQIRY